MKPLTLQEACNLLGIDHATLYRWLQRANIKPEPDVHDRRRHTLSQAQLTHLARLHHRLLPEKTRQARQSDREALRPSEMEEVISQTETRFAALEGRLETLERKLEETQAYAFSSLSDEAHLSGRLHSLEIRLTSLERDVSALHEALQRLETPLERETPAPAQSKILRPAPAPTAEIPASGTLPEGWIPLYDLMKQYQTPSRSTVFRQMKDFIHRGHWIVNGHEVNNALDAEGQAEFRRRYVEGGPGFGQK